MRTPNQQNAASTWRYREAIHARDLAEQECPHWDQEGGPYNELDCCYNLREARLAVRRARRAYLISKGADVA